jgi:hypothetical protein
LTHIFLVHDHHNNPSYTIPLSKRLLFLAWLNQNIYSPFK